MASTINKVVLCALPIAFYAFNLTLVQVLIFSSAFLILQRLIDSGTKPAYRFPPGPKGLPVIGSLHSLMYQGQDEYFLSLSRKYGPIVTVKLGGLLNVVINDYDVMKEMGAHPDFQGRPQIGFLRIISEGYGIGDAEGPLWKHQRRFLMHSLRDSGMGKIRMEEKICNELEKVTSDIAECDGRPMPIGNLLEKATCNVIFDLICNRSFDYDDPILISTIDKFNENIKLSEKLIILTLFEFLQKLFKSPIKTLLENLKYIRGQIEGIIREHEQTLDEGDPRDFIDLFFTEMKSSDIIANPENREYHETFSESQLKGVIDDLFGAGTETSSTTIRWAILYMLHYPEIQKKVQKEIDDVVGGNRAPTMADKLNLPFTVATLQEVERLASVAPRGLPRSNQKPAQFREYLFPKRCMFTFNVHAVHRDPKLWDNPEEFKPERFINGEGNVFRPPHLLPFGIGKRSCAGEGLARMEIYLFFATLMQKFTFLPPDGKLPSIEPMSGLIRGPEHNRVVAKPRLVVC